MAQLIGILNITPDSFSDGGLYDDFDAAIKQAKQLFDDGAALVDIGAESTRPNATALTAAEEWQRLAPIVTHLQDIYPGRISVDTYHPETAEMALGLGDIIINDVTGMNNPAMVETVAARGARCIVSHLPGADIQAAHLETSVTTVEQVKKDLLERAALLESKGLARDRIWLDPGIGFGKTMELNRQLLEFAGEVPDYGVVIGYSRKRFLGENRMELAVNLEAGRTAIAAGAAYLRVHDVAGHKDLVQ
jgi:dihydropteroate synthase